MPMPRGCPARLRPSPRIRGGNVQKQKLRREAGAPSPACLARGYRVNAFAMVAFISSWRMFQAVMYFMVTPRPCLSKLPPADCSGPRTAREAGKPRPAGLPVNMTPNRPGKAQVEKSSPSRFARRDHPASREESPLRQPRQPAGLATQPLPPSSHTTVIVVRLPQPSMAIVYSARL